MSQVKLYLRQPEASRTLAAPPDLKVPFWPMRAKLENLESYESTAFWFTGMKKATKKTYGTHLRLFCRFYSTTPDILVMMSAAQLKPLLDAYLMYLVRIAAKEAGKPKPGRVSVNSVGQYFTGLRSFFVNGHEKEINWVRYENKFPERVANSLRGYYLEEVQKMYKLADIYDKPLVYLKYADWMRVGAVGPIQFQDLTPSPDFPGYYILRPYADTPADSYPVVVPPDVMNDIEELKEYRQRVWGEKITGESYIICQKYSPHCKVKKKQSPLSETAIRNRMKQLAKQAGVDLTNIQPCHGMRKAGNTAAKNAHMDKEFKELMMGHTTGLDDIYYDVENPQSRREIVAEYIKAVDMLTINQENRLRKENQELKNENDTRLKSVESRLDYIQEYLADLAYALPHTGLHSVPPDVAVRNTEATLKAVAEQLSKLAGDKQSKYAEKLAGSAMS